MATNIPPGSTHLNYTIGALVAVGGAAGYAKQKSVRSLAAGLILGAAFCGSAFLIGSSNPERGFRVATLTSIALSVAMGARFAKTQKVMPAGALAVLGLASTAYNGSKWREFS
jgi:uncharacterized membrane protein (UPF0136 family)